MVGAANDLTVVACRPVGTSRILEGLAACGGLVELQRRVCWSRLVEQAGKGNYSLNIHVGMSSRRGT